MVALVQGRGQQIAEASAKLAADEPMAVVVARAYKVSPKLAAGDPGALTGRLR
jgi:hypothetical protein